MGPLGVPETIFIFVLALLLFGPKKLPELGKTIGKALTEFRRASAELKSTFEGHMAEIEREGQGIKQSVQSYTNEIYNYDSNTNSSSPYESSNYSYDSNYGNDSSYYNSGSYGSDQPSDSGTSSGDPTTVSASAVQGAESNVNGQPATAESQATQVAETAPPPHSEGTSAAPAEPANGKPSQTQT